MTKPNYFGAEIAERYDKSVGEEFEPTVIAATADFLAGVAGGGAALEFGIGTGRIALPLVERGVPVHGIDLSPEMVARLRQKPGAKAIPVAIGDFATTRVDGTFALVYLVFNTIMNLTTQDEQVACFQNAAAHLEPGGRFVIEVGRLSTTRLSVFDLGETHVGIDEYDAATQRLVSHHFTLVDGHWKRTSGPFRSVSPAELDLMARLADLRLRERWGGWRREPFTSESRKYVSVWEKSS
jgi:SAM-dependent methyltransferase